MSIRTFKNFILLTIFLSCPYLGAEYKRRALILVDIQNDFLEGGSLAVPDANAVIPVAQKLLEAHNFFFHRIVATKDWHPAFHISFASQHPGKNLFESITLPGGLQQILWPDHCVQNSHGSELASELRDARIDKIIYKGTNPLVDSYSGFRDNSRTDETGLRAYLQAEQIMEVYIMGLASDYCVGFTAQDALEMGFKTYLILDGSRGVDDKSVEEMYKKLGKEGAFGRVHFIKSDAILSKRDLLL